MNTKYNEKKNMKSTLSRVEVTSRMSDRLVNWVELGSMGVVILFLIGLLYTRMICGL